MVRHGGSSASSYLADPTSPTHRPPHCASIIVTSSLRDNRLNHHLLNTDSLIYELCGLAMHTTQCIILHLEVSRDQCFLCPLQLCHVIELSLLNFVTINMSCFTQHFLFHLVTFSISPVALCHMINFSDSTWSHFELSNTLGGG